MHLTLGTNTTNNDYMQVSKSVTLQF